MHFGAIHHINPQGKGTAHILFMQSREAPVETAVMTFTALLGTSVFQLFSTAAGTGCQVQKVPAPNCIAIILYYTVELSFCLPGDLYCVERVVFEGEMQLFCGGNPLSWPSGCQIHRDAEQCRNGEGG